MTAWQYYSPCRNRW